MPPSPSPKRQRRHSPQPADAADATAPLDATDAADAPYVRIELRGISRHAAREITETIERVVAGEAAARRAASIKGGSAAAVAAFGASAVAPQVESRREVIFSDRFCVDRTGVQSIPRDLANPQTWEAWNVPLHDVTSPASSSSSSSASSASSSSSSSSSALSASSTNLTHMCFADRGGHNKSRPVMRGRYHTAFTATSYQPGQLSPALRAALGMSAEASAPVPWLDRMRRYGFPPGYVLDDVRKTGALSLDIIDSGSSSGGSSGSGSDSGSDSDSDTGPDSDKNSPGSDKAAITAAAINPIKAAALALFDFPLYIGGTESTRAQFPDLQRLGQPHAARWHASAKYPLKGFQVGLEPGTWPCPIS